MTVLSFVMGINVRRKLVFVLKQGSDVDETFTLRKHHNIRKQYVTECEPFTAPMSKIHHNRRRSCKAIIMVLFCSARSWFPSELRAPSVPVQVGVPGGASSSHTFSSGRLQRLWPTRGCAWNAQSMGGCSVVWSVSSAWQWYHEGPPGETVWIYGGRLQF